MAGIGFELKKIYGRKTLTSSVMGTLYASFTTIGATVIFICLLLFAEYAMDIYEATEMERMFFISAFTYELLVAILLCGFFNTVVSRFISDKVFEHAEDEICASLFGVLVTGGLITAAVLLVFCIQMHIRDDIPVSFLIVYYFLGIFASNTYNLMTYVSALKEYRKVTFSYIAGFVFGVGCVFLLAEVFRVPIVMALYTGLALAFFIIQLLLILACVRAFGKPCSKIFLFLKYFRRFPKLCISGGAYMLGFYISNIIYWNISDMQVKVSIFRTTPVYDVAMFAAIIVNLSAMVIFVVKTETAFYDKYVSYLSALNHGSYKLIEKSRMNMQNTLRLQLFFVYEIQLILTVLAVCIANAVFPYLGLGTQSLNFFMILAMGLYATMCMYFTVIFLYYFEAHTEACLVPCVFLVVEVIAVLICHALGRSFYPVPILAAGIIGWAVSFLCLRRCLVHLNRILLCRS